MNDHDDMRARLELADLYTRNREIPRAVDQYLDAAARYEDNGFELKAMGVYLQVVRVAPKSAEAHVALGRHYVRHGLYVDAAKHFDQALANVQGDDIARARLDVVREIMTMDPQNVMDRLRLAEAYSAEGHLAEAAKEFRAAAEVLDEGAAEGDFQLVAERLLYHQPDAAAVAKKLATAYVSQDEPQRALSKLQKAYDALPNDLEVLGLLADTFNQLGQVHKSVAVLKEMARLYDANGLLHERDECYTRVLQLDPNDRTARDAVGESTTGAEGQTLDLGGGESDEDAPRAALGRIPDAPEGPTDMAAVLPSSGLDDLDFDFELDDDDDEIGFGGTVETTIVDDAFIPEDVRSHLGPELGLALAVPGATEKKPTSAGALQDELRELDFYINNNLREEAQALLRELTDRHGQHPLLERRERELAPTTAD